MKFQNKVTLNMGIPKKMHDECFKMLEPWGFTAQRSDVGEWEGEKEDVLILKGSLDASLDEFEHLLGHLCDFYKQEAISFKIEIKDLVWGMGVGPKYEFSDEFFQDL